MRLCLIPSTICSNWRRNCSLAAEEDMALRDRRTEHTRQHACSYVLVTACFYSLLEVVMDRVEQIHLQTGKQRWAFGRCRRRCCVHWPPSPGKPSCRLACCTAWRTASSLCAWQKLKQRMWESLLLSGLGKHRAAHTHLGCRAPGTSSGTESARPDWALRRSSSAGRRSHGSFEPECRSEVTWTAWSMTASPPWALPASWLAEACVCVWVCIYHEQPDPLQLLFLRVVLSVNQLVSLLDNTKTDVTVWEAQRHKGRGDRTFSSPSSCPDAAFSSSMFCCRRTISSCKHTPEVRTRPGSRSDICDGGGRGIWWK